MRGHKERHVAIPGPRVSLRAENVLREPLELELVHQLPGLDQSPLRQRVHGVDRGGSPRGGWTIPYGRSHLRVESVECAKPGAEVSLLRYIRRRIVHLEIGAERLINGVISAGCKCRTECVLGVDCWQPLVPVRELHSQGNLALIQA